MEDPKRMEEGLGHTALVANIDDENIHLSEKEGKTDGGDDNEKEERRVVHDHQAEREGDRQPVVKQKSKRVATLDAFRGLTIVVSTALNSQFIYFFLLQRKGSSPET
jgi:heparan-alpha-glucosaminide N-acetyltransferase